MLISIDGLDGSGKTTLAVNISKYIGFRYVNRSFYELFPMNNNAIEVAKMIEQEVFYNTESDKLKSIVACLGLIYLKECRSENIVVDRGVISCYAYNGNKNTENIFQTFIDSDLEPDISILLYADNDTRIKRMSKRNTNDIDLQDPDVLKQDYDMLKKYIEKSKTDIILIDTTKKTEEEVFHEAIKELHNRNINENKALSKRLMNSNKPEEQNK